MKRDAARKIQLELQSMEIENDHDDEPDYNNIILDVKFLSFILLGFVLVNVFLVLNKITVPYPSKDGTNDPKPWNCVNPFEKRVM